MRIFLSYRRSDVGGYAGRLNDALVQRLGADNVFQDVTDIAPGRDFLRAIEDALTASDAAVAVIGPAWLTAASPEGKLRLFEPDDLVRLELATMLQRDLPVAPVLVGGASLPAAADLPEELRPLVRRQAIVLRDATWHQDVDSMLRALRPDGPVSAPAPRPKVARRTLLAVGVGLAVVALLAGLVLWLSSSGGTGDGSGDDGGDDATAVELPACPDTTAADWTALPAPPADRVPDGDGVFAVGARGARWRVLGPGSWEVVVETELENISSDVVDHASWRYDALLVARRPFPVTCFTTGQPLLIPNSVSGGTIGAVVRCQPSGLIELVLDEGRLRIPATAAAEPSPC